MKRRRVSAYVAGPSLGDALAVTQRLADCGLAGTVGYMAGRDEPPRAAADVHLSAFARLAAEDRDCQVSVKLSGLRFDAGLLAELAEAAARSSRPLHIDALGPETVDDTWRLLEGAPRGGPIGTTLPGRWARSVDDAARVRELGLRVRVVKGQWADTDGRDVDPSQGFLRVVDTLCGHGGGVAVATHDVDLLDASLQRLLTAGTACWAELFFGMPFRGPALAARRLGVGVRVYVPYGHAGAPYEITDVAGRPAVAWWLLQDLLLGREKTWGSIRRSHARG